MKQILSTHFFCHCHSNKGREYLCYKLAEESEGMEWNKTNLKLSNMEKVELSPAKLDNIQRMPRC